MFTSTTMRIVMSALSIAIVATTFVAPAANACDGNKTESSVKHVRPLTSIVQGIKNLFNRSSNKSPKQEPSTDDSGFVPDADASDLIIGG